MDKLLVAVLEASIKAILVTHLFDLDRTVWVCGGVVLVGLAFLLGGRERRPPDVKLPPPDSGRAVEPHESPRFTVVIKIDIDKNGKP